MTQEEWILANQEAMKYFGLSCIQAMVVLSGPCLSPSASDAAEEIACC